ncbi:phosphoenolpyruvate--protein phosphotransferase [Geothermobacter ehrlichii]|uniref:Phosphoenolpyruvate-protein phosphotransferase n=1 Tax=Geothermobacter ehrlichii TaxID=213224 RepID=A0A5D3WM04_9BACT|nr:phosphoenolpyruvate--protein phosphotransferase [Geothermobacter ehrlichii]TYO99519.1 phosphoenolpyruvate--protein phosphotransferase [Geothermobacter ehrlichii]
MVSAKTEIVPDTFLVGIGVSPGIAIGQAHLLSRARMAAIERSIDPSDVDAEVAAFEEAVEQSRRQLEEVKRKIAVQHPEEHLYIIDTHLMMLNDQMLHDETVHGIRDRLLNAEGALKRALDRFRSVFANIEDEYLRDRAGDVESIGERLLRNLMGESRQELSQLDHKAIVVAHDLSPAETMQIDRDKVLGFVTDVGGRTSHTAIVARSLGIPAVVGLENVTAMVPGGTPMIIDGGAGTVILNPTESTFREYLQKKQRYEYFEKELLSYRTLPAETPDGHRLILRGNVELPIEVDQVREQGAEGIGLYRSEFLFFGRLTPPDEEEQYQAYRQLIESVAPHEVTIRTLDVGGDKFVPDINLADEANPALGLRGVRFSLADRSLFKTQLRAILRASVHGPVRVMFPMVSGVAEVRGCRAMLEEAKDELKSEGLLFDDRLAAGIMVETPAAAFIADQLAEEVDFFSVGTNDLVQYCLAVDRGNEHVAYLYEPLHPAILRALRMVCEAGRRAGISVAMCGEMASESLYLPILLGLGFTELSMNAPCIPRVKRIVRQVRRSEAEELLAAALEMKTATEVAAFLEQEMASRFPGIYGTTNI